MSACETHLQVTHRLILFVSPKSHFGLKILTGEKMFRSFIYVSTYLEPKSVKASAFPLLHELEYMQRIHNVDPHHRGHPHVLQMKDHFNHSGQRGDHLCLVMDLMAEDAMTFSHHCYKERLPLRLARQVSKDIIMGLEYLHDACNIIHTGVLAVFVLVLSLDLLS